MRPAALAHLQRAGFSESLGERLAELARRHRVPGAQLAVCRGADLTVVQAGVEDPDTGRPLTGLAKIPVGSITKAFTATLAMVLVADGDLELDTPVGAIAPGLGGRARALFAPVTVRQLLSHTGGLPSDPDESATSARQAFDRLHGIPPIFPPGAGFSYSNIGYLLVGGLIEEITGMPWGEAMRSILLRPLKIDPAFLGDPIVPGHAVNSVTGQVRAVGQTLPSWLAPAGALALSARDLVEFGRMHLLPGNGVAASNPLGEGAAELRKAVPGADAAGLADGWSPGFAVFREGDRTRLGHDGMADGTACYLRLDPEAGWVVALTTNARTGTALWEDLVGELRLAGLPVPHYRIRHDPARLRPVPSDCFGVYRNGNVEYSLVTRAAGAPVLVVDGEAYPEFTLDESWTFSVVDPDSGKPHPCGRFLRDPHTSAVTGMQIGGRVAQRYRVRS
ncbi:serine hydrolase domain-containing protein [Amycolatopsis anabasis]|uniref:serine hydrolase domain-containing protein n=1 Tax=Amycolatopsis anabasis TaxID=1840409 RepID=UPI001FE2629F|nr:serine hydrolase domain-containing protein [Amycolatopsis anabasis]